jgi:NADH:ubiquinone oxidoreductase subunit 6 (subunit J)
MQLIPSDGLTILSGIIFLIFAAMTLMGALAATFAKRLIRSVSGLALCFVGMAGLYYYLHSPFLALMQIVIYVGAICIMIMFTMMLAEPRGNDGFTPMGAVLSALALAGCLLMAGGLIVLTGTYPSPVTQQYSSIVSVKEIGRDLLNQHGLVFELISGVLLIAIIGAILIGRAGRRKT